MKFHSKNPRITINTSATLQKTKTVRWSVMVVATTVQLRSQPDAAVPALKQRFGDFAVVDFKFVDLLGKWQHFSIPVEEFNAGPLP